MNGAAFGMGLLAAISAGVPGAGSAGAANAAPRCADFTGLTVGEAYPTGLTRDEFSVVLGRGSSAAALAGPDGIAGIGLRGPTAEVHPPQSAIAMQLSVSAAEGGQMAAFDDRGHLMKAEVIPAGTDWTDVALDMSAYMGRFKIKFLRLSAPDGSAVVVRTACVLR